MTAILDIYEKDRLIKTSSVKYFFINHHAKMIEVLRTNIYKYIKYKQIDVAYENGICLISLYR